MGRTGRREAHWGLQAELLLGLCLVMATATAVLGAVALRVHHAQLLQLRELAARGLLEEASAPAELARPSGSQWWVARRDGRVVARGGDAPIDGAGRELAEAATRRGEPLLRAGAPWAPLWLAAPDRDGATVVVRIPAVAPPALLAGLVIGAIAVFTAFGASVLRGRVVRPLQRLAAGVRAVAEGRLDAQVPEEGVAETAEVARGFNEMAAALAARTAALEKAVADLRESNRRLRTAREGLDRAERLAAVGRLAAGVAHEVGNPMGALLAFLDLVRREPGLSEPGRGLVDRAAREGERVRVILRGLLDFSRPARGEPGALDVVDLAEETVALVRAQRRYADVDLRVESEPTPPAAFADRGAVAQVLLNLVLNAADAARQRSQGGGHVVVSVRGAPGSAREGEPPSARAARRGAEVVEVRVEDDGPGIAAEHRERIFDPFFTTKAPGEGTGLGLANALRIAEQLGGRLDLAPEQRSEGAAFLLQLPALAAPGDSGSAVRSLGHNKASKV